MITAQSLVALGIREENGQNNSEYENVSIYSYRLLYRGYKKWGGDRFLIVSCRILKTMLSFSEFKPSHIILYNVKEKEKQSTFLMNYPVNTNIGKEIV